MVNKLENPTFKNIVKNFNEMGFFKNPKILKEGMYILDLLPPDRDRLFLDIEIFIKNLNIMFKDDWTITIKSESSLKMSIFFKKIKVESENKMVHIIHNVFFDIIINLYYDHGNFSVDFNFEMRRTKFSFGEVLHGYMHSHANWDASISHMFNPCEGCHFCIGSSTLKSASVIVSEEMSLESEKLTDKDAIEFLLSVRDVVSWESISGNPYNRISNISEISSDYSRRRDFLTEDDSIEEVLRRIPPSLYRFCFTDGSMSGFYCTDVFIDFIKETLIDMKLYHLLDMINSEGSYSMIEHCSEEMKRKSYRIYKEESALKKVIFNGHIYPVEISKPFEKITGVDDFFAATLRSSTEVRVTPSFIKIITETINKRINKINYEKIKKRNRDTGIYIG